MSTRFVRRNWTFGMGYCRVNNFIAYLSVAVSVFTLMAISIDRFASNSLPGTYTVPFVG